MYAVIVVNLCHMYTSCTCVANVQCNKLASLVCVCVSVCMGGGGGVGGVREK